MYRHVLTGTKRLTRSVVTRATSSLASKYKEGDLIHGYRVERVRAVPDFFLSAIELKHSKTDTYHLHLARNDDNNVFNVLLRTTPMDDTGVAHILEHVVLCGSKKYPVRDPFMKMLDRSMASFMNAITGSDFTMYPFATQNPSDFKNLLSVYLDAVFFPEIAEMSFIQEGWRLEHQDNADQTSPIVLKGVVFNEMKGVMADQDYLFGTNLQRRILPDHTYGVCSGGDPLSIPKLSWQNLRDFHRTHYHPSNAKFLTYGNMDLEGHLELIDREVMQKFSPIEPDTDVPPQPRWASPRSSAVACPVDDMAANKDKQTSIAMSYLLSDVSDTFESFLLTIICNLLADGASSPFYKALIDSGLGSSYSPASGLHTHQKESVFSIGLQGVREEDTEKVCDIIENTFDDVIENGFPEERVEGVLHQLELGQKHQSSQFGLHLSFNLMPLWQHGADPMQMLQLNQHIEKLKDEIKKDPKFLQKCCEKYFRGNRHKLTLKMSPDAKYQEQKDAEEESILMSKVEALNEADKQRIFDEGRILADLQNKKEDLACLPTLKVSDVPRKPVEKKVMKTFDLGSEAKIVTYEEPTNGVSYLTLIRSIEDFSDELKPFLPLFCSVFTEMGTEDTDYRTFSQLEDLYTGGLSTSIDVSPSPLHPNAMESKFILRSHCLDRNIGKMCDLLQELLNKPNFCDLDRFQTLVRQRAQGLANSVAFNGHSYAMLSASADLTPSSHQTETWRGLTQVKLMRSIAEMESLDPILSKMREISACIFSSSEARVDNLRCSIHATSNAITGAGESLVNLLSNTMIKGGEVLKPVDNSEFMSRMKPSSFSISKQPNVLHELPLPVNFAALSLPTEVTYCHPDSSALRVLSRILSTKFLLREVREKGGAYGAGARHGIDGVFQFYSYRDPHTLNTVDAFHRSIEWGATGGFTPQDMDEAKLAIFQKVDAPVSPCNRGKAHFEDGISDQMKQDHRERLLDVTKDEIVAAAVKHLGDVEKSKVSILGPANEQIQTANEWKVQSSR